MKTITISESSMQFHSSALNIENRKQNEMNIHYFKLHFASALLNNFPKCVVFLPNRLRWNEKKRKDWMEVCWMEVRPIKWTRGLERKDKKNKKHFEKKEKGSEGGEDRKRLSGQKRMGGRGVGGKPANSRTRANDSRKLVVKRKKETVSL